MKGGVGEALYKLISIFLLLSVAGFSPVVAASPSVATGTGKISVDTTLQPSQTAALPPMTVYNDGTSEGIFYVEVVNNEKQPQHKLEDRWFSFSHREFKLGPGMSQVVNIQLSLPANAESGEYFGYIEAGARDISTTGNARISGASAAKLTFSVDDDKPQTHSSNTGDGYFSRLITALSLPKIITSANHNNFSI